MPRHVLVVLTNAVDGRHDDFNTWYEDVHLGDVLGVEGFTAAQRFRLAERQMVEDRSYEYLAIYEIDEEDLGTALDALRGSSGSMVISDALADGAKALAFTAIGPRHTG